MLECRAFLSNSVSAKLYMEMEEVNDIFRVNVGMYLMIQDMHISPKH